MMWPEALNSQVSLILPIISHFALGDKSIKNMSWEWYTLKPTLETCFGAFGMLMALKKVILN